MDSKNGRNLAPPKMLLNRLAIIMDDVNLTAITEEAFFAKKYTLLANIHGKKIVSAESFSVFYRYDTNTSASKSMSW